MVLHLFFIFVSINLMVVEQRNGSLTNKKGRELMMSKDCNMLSMLPTENIEGEEYGPEEAFAEYLRMGLRPREAAPEDVKPQERDEEQEQGNDKGTLWQGLMKMKSDDIRDDVITMVYDGGVNTTVKSAKDKSQSHPRPVVRASALSVASRPCVSRTLGLSLSCQSSRCTAVRTPVCQSHTLSKGTVAESSVEETLLPVNVPVSSLSLHGGSSLALKSLGVRSCICLML